MAKYEPPKQGKGGQLFDSLFILVLVYASLLAPLFIDFSGGDGGGGDAAATAHTWESLGQNATMQAQWEKLGFDAQSASEIILSRFDYTIDPLHLIITAVVLIGYFVLMLRLSDREYRDVINEKFGNGR